MRKIGFMLGGLVVLVGSFLITNWILSKNNEGLNWRFTNEATLAAAATAAGFHSSKDLSGSVDAVVRIDNEKVRANGWVVDLSGDGTPIKLSAFVNGLNIATFDTDGPRLDVTEKIIKPNLRANQNSAKNTQFKASFPCAPGAKLFVVATTATRSYLLLPHQPAACP
jgi:hypothetical protein